MYLYYSTDKRRLGDLRRDGIPADNGRGTVKLWRSLKAAQSAQPKGIVLVADVGGVEAVGKSVRVAPVPAADILNLTPYQPPRPLVAGGGYVMRPGTDEPDVLLIFRRGLWDLPKGKLDEGETPSEGALREVREEVGIKRLKLVAPLGITVHGYPEGEAYRIKTTHWFRMKTSETTFVPQAKEQIERVEWVPWSRAKALIGYDSLRRHMDWVEGMQMGNGE